MTTTTRRQLLAGDRLAALGGALPARAFAGTRRSRPSPICSSAPAGTATPIPGPSLPFGMVQLGPDTDNERWDACSGYHRDRHVDHGLLAHASVGHRDRRHARRAGGADARAAASSSPGTLDDPDAGYRQRFSDEHAEPGYYRVKLESGVLAELTVTERTGCTAIASRAAPGHILIDFAHMILDVWDKGTLIDEASLALDAGRRC